jgi:hypothetical protein
MSVQETKDISAEEAEALSKRFCLGITLKSFKVFTTDNTYKNQIVRIDEGVYKNEVDKLTFKVAKIDGFSFFCNWDQVEKPENGAINLENLESDPTFYIK